MQAIQLKNAYLNEKLLTAVMENNGNWVRELLNKGADPNCFEDECLLRPLHFAACYNADTCVFWLIKAGAKINALNQEGFTPLEIAKQLSHHKVSFLLRSFKNVVSLLPLLHKDCA